MRLNTQTALITGASAGIGIETARLFAEEGARLILLARREELLRRLADELKDSTGCETQILVCDVREVSAVNAAIAKLPESWRDIDLLINNAGLSRGLDKIHEGRLQDWEEMIDTNIKGLLYVSKAVLPGMVARGRGMVINVASIAGREVYPRGNVYCATKHAAKALSQAMMIDTNGTGVRVCNIDPGLVETEFSQVRFRGDSELARQVYEGYTPLKGRDVAEAILFCATRPAHVNIADMLIFPSDQASSTLVHKRKMNYEL